jgi:cell wall-associated NlpC family hydrolase
MQAHGTVVDSIANVYSQPSTEVEMVTQAVLGTPLSIEESREGWHHVHLPDHYRGWLEARHTKIHGQEEARYPATARVAEIQGLLAALYYEPDATSRPPALQVPIGARLEVAGETDGWVQVVLPDRAGRWVQQGDVRVLEAHRPQPRGSVRQVIDTARRFLGRPYLWGGTTPLGIDCSGFVQLVYRLNGVSLLRDSAIQYTQPDLTPVERGALQTGDLLFFGQMGITHVGLYMGQGEFIHATTHGQPIVQISRLDEPHWTGLFQGARRP